ncbi:unnamed protein product [Prorocentrum cordatum]|uniref:Uncharacterized protein n=1 Tax=Prorocentrum cordatum TaxID=2364126 RepID=A0ABN9RZK8_9DINO|nr:unnamed protein product [Polarella glacialis]
MTVPPGAAARQAGAAAGAVRPRAAHPHDASRATALAALGEEGVSRRPLRAAAALGAAAVLAGAHRGVLQNGAFAESHGQAVTAVCGECGAPPWPAGQMGGTRLSVAQQQFIGDCKSIDEEVSEPVEEPTKAFGDQVARVLDPSMDALSSERVGITVHMPMGGVVVQTVRKELPAVPVFPVLGKCGLAEDDRDVEALLEEAVKLEAAKVEAKTVKVAMAHHVDSIEVPNASAWRTEKTVNVPMAEHVEDIFHVPVGVTQESEETEKIVKVPMAEYVENIVYVPPGVTQASAAGAYESAAAGSEQDDDAHEYEKEAVNELDDVMKATVAANQLAHARAADPAACRRAQWRLEHDELEDAAVFGTAVLAAPRVATPQRETMVEAEVLTGLAEDESQGGDVIYADAPGGLCDQIVQACDPPEPGSEEHETALARVLEGFGLAVDGFRSMLTSPVGKKRLVTFEQGGWGAGLYDWLHRAADVVNRGFSGYRTGWVRSVLPGALGAASSFVSSASWRWCCSSGTASQRALASSTAWSSTRQTWGHDLDGPGGRSRGGRRRHHSPGPPPPDPVGAPARVVDLARRRAAAVRAMPADAVVDLWDEALLFHGLGAAGSRKLLVLLKRALRRLPGLQPRAGGRGRLPLPAQYPHWGELGGRDPRQAERALSLLVKASSFMPRVLAMETARARKPLRKGVARRQSIRSLDSPLERQLARVKAEDQPVFVSVTSSRRPWRAAVGELVQELQYVARNTPDRKWDFAIAFITGHPEDDVVLEATRLLDKRLGTDGCLLGVDAEFANGTLIPEGPDSQEKTVSEETTAQCNITVTAMRLPRDKDGSLYDGVQGARPFAIGKEELMEISMLTLKLQETPGAQVYNQTGVNNATPLAWRQYLGIEEEPQGILLFADPGASDYTMKQATSEACLLSAHLPDLPAACEVVVPPCTFPRVKGVVCQQVRLSVHVEVELLLLGWCPHPVEAEVLGAVLELPEA